MSPPLSPSEALPSAPPCVATAEAAAWFEDEVYPHDEALKAFLRKRYPAIRDVEDVVQESYVRMWRTKLKGKIAHSKGFLFAAAKNLAIDFLRKNRVVPLADFPDFDASLVLDETPGVREAAARREDFELLARAIATLPPRCREVMILCRVEGLSQKAAAERLGITVNTIETQVEIGLRKTIAYMEDHRKP